MGILQITVFSTHQIHQRITIGRKEKIIIIKLRIKKKKIK